jgi:hypothetical protein
LGREHSYDYLHRTGRIRPEHRRPETFGSDWLAQMFHELSTCRAIGSAGIGPIPATAIWAYVDRYRMPDWTIDAIFSLDAAWLTRMRAGADA